jgi:double-strand break repair protein MRE11
LQETTGGGSFSVMQPGSSVATALSEGESRPKQATLVEIVGSDWRTIKIPLSTVRPFAFGSITLAAQQGLDHEEPKTVAEFLSKKVSEMIDSAIRNRGPKTPELPLVRLRVDYTGFSTINTQRFGQKFVGKVANPHDIILWQKAPVRRTRAALAETNNALAALRAAAAEDQVRIEDLIATHLQHNLEVLPEVELTGALREFVDKDEKRALEDTVGNALKETQAAVVQGTLAKRSRDANGDGHGASVVAIEEGQQQRGTNRQHEDNDGLDDIFEGKKGEKELARLIADVSKKRKAEAEAVAMERQRREEQQAAAEAAASHPSGVPTTSGAVSAARGRGRGQARGAAASRAATRVPVKTTAASAASKPSSFDDGRDSFEDEDEDGDDDRTTRALPPSKPRARSSRAAASAAKSKITSSMRAAGSMRHTVEPSDDDEFMEDGGDVMSVDEDDDEEEDDDDAVQDFEEAKDLAREVAALRQRSRPARKARTIGGTGAGVGTAEDPIALDMTDDEDGADLLDSQPSKIYSTTIGRGATTQPTGRTKGASQMKWGALK